VIDAILDGLDDAGKPASIAGSVTKAGAGPYSRVSSRRDQMAASAGTRGGPASAGLHALRVAVCGGIAAIGASFVSPAPAKADDGVIYVNAAQGYSSAALGSALLRSLGEQFKFTLAGIDTDREVMQRVAADPRSIGLVQRDLYVQYLHEHADSDTRFEFYGNIPVCLMAVVRKGSQIQSYGDLVRVRTNRPTMLDVGPATGQLAGTFETLREMDRSLANLQLEHLGGARALGRVITGETDAALFLVLAPYSGGLVFDMIDSDALDPVPFFSEDIVIGASRRKLPYLLRQIKLGNGGWFSSGRPYHTTCTSIGAVVNATADEMLSDKVAQTLLEDAPAQSQRPWYAAVGSVFVVAFGEVKRLLVDAGEVLTAWFSPATPNEAIAAAPAAAPELQPARQGANEWQGHAPPTRAPPPRAR